MSPLKRKSADSGNPVLMPKIKKKNEMPSENDGPTTIGGDDDPKEESRLNEDALCLVMDFLGPRALYNLAFSCKAMMSRVTTSRVMRAAILNYNGKGQYAKQSLAYLQDLVRNRAIHLPSPLRLLRLINGRRCEFCNLKRVNTVREFYGCFLCPSCLETHCMFFTAADRRTLFLPRRFLARGMWRETYDAGGEPIGPVVLYHHVRGAAENSSSEEDFCLPIPHNAPLADRRDAFLEDYKDAMCGERRMKMLQRVHGLQKCSSLKEKRTIQLGKFIEQVRENLDERWRSFALVVDDRPWRVTRLHLQFHVSDYMDVVPFRCPIVQRRLCRFAKAPSKARRKLAKEAAKDINEVYQRILSSDLLSFAFLRNLPGLSDDDAEQLCQYALANYQSLQAFVHGPMFKYAEGYVDNDAKKDRDFVKNLSITDCWLEQNFGHLLLDPFSEAWELGLAQRIWTTLPVYSRGTTNLSEFLVKGRLSFRRVRERARSFLVWLKSQDDVDEAAVHRMEACIAAYDPCSAPRRFGVHSFFLNGNFEDLRTFFEEQQQHNLSLAN